MRRDTARPPRAHALRRHAALLLAAAVLPLAARAAEPPAARPAPGNGLRFLLENQGSDDQIAFDVDLYPGTPTCETTPVPAMRTEAPVSAQNRQKSVEIPRNKVLSFTMVGFYPGANGGEASCRPGALTFVATDDSEYRAVYREKDTRCWIELWAIDLEKDGRTRRVPVEAKPLKIAADGRHGCDWVQPK